MKRYLISIVFLLGFLAQTKSQNVDWYEGEFVPFLGRLACANKGPALLALKTGTPVLPIFSARQPGGKYKIIIEWTEIITVQLWLCRFVKNKWFRGVELWCDLPLPNPQKFPGLTIGSRHKIWSWWNRYQSKVLCVALVLAHRHTSADPVCLFNEIVITYRMSITSSAQ